LVLLWMSMLCVVVKSFVWETDTSSFPTHVGDRVQACEQFTVWGIFKGGRQDDGDVLPGDECRVKI
jgi:hypothetical protein